MITLITVLVESEVGMEEYIALIHTHEIHLADRNLFHHLFKERAELLLTLQVLLQTVKALVEGALEKRPYGFLTVELTCYEIHKKEIIINGVSILTLRGLKLHDEILINHRLLRHGTVVSPMVIKYKVNGRVC